MAYCHALKLLGRNTAVSLEAIQDKRPIYLPSLLLLLVEGTTYQEATIMNLLSTTNFKTIILDVLDHT